MALPDNCMGLEQGIRCLYDERTNEALTSIIDGLKAQTPSTASATTISTDDITSRSLMRNKSYICSSQIVKRDYTYGISIAQNTVLFSWDFLGVLSNLPVGYKSAKIDVKVTGSSSSSNALIPNSKTSSGGISLSAANFPISVDILVRVTSPCGDIDLTSQFAITNPSAVGTYGTKFAIRDLNPQTGEIGLTTQLNSLEDQTSSNALSISTALDLIKELKLEITDLKSQIANL